jgi:uncharacterized protein DUF4397
MKILFKYTLVVGVVLLTLYSCEKNTFAVSERTTPTGVALVKIGYFSATNVNTQVLGYINNVRVTNVLAQPISFPGGGLNMGGSSNADYLQVTPGSTVFDFYVPVAGTAVPTSKYFSTTQNLVADKKYTLFITDTAANTTAFVVSDDAATPDSGFARMKFANAIPGSNSVDLYKGPTLATSTLLKPDIKYKTATDYFDVPSGTDSFFVRLAGAPITTAPIVRRGFPLANQRIYTMFGRGYIGQTSTTRGINLSVIINQ